MSDIITSRKSRAGVRTPPTTYNSDGSPTDIQNIHNNFCVDGDIITLPSGTFDWVTTVNVSKAIAIKGNTTVDSVNGTAVDNTILRDNFSRSGNTRFFDAYPIPENGLFELAGLTLTTKPGVTQQGTGAIAIGAPTSPITAKAYANIHHLHFTGINMLNGIQVYQGMRGVAHHILENNLVSQCLQNSVMNGLNSWGTQYGDQQWTIAIGWGTDDFFFFEDYYIDNASNGLNNAAGGWDGSMGAKFVIRRSKFFGVEILCHGTEIGRRRGGMAQEIYRNEYHFIAGAGLDGIRSGALLTHDNNFYGSKPGDYNLNNYRPFANNFGITRPGAWGNADGESGWDINATESDGSHVDGHTPYIFATGTCVAGSSQSQIQVAGTPWTAHQWKVTDGSGGYVVKRNSDGAMALILDNTANILNLYLYDAAISATWAVGDAFKIRKVLTCLDQPGRGVSDLLEGETPTPVWLHSTPEPCYEWNNIFVPDGSHVSWAIAPQVQPFLKLGRDAFANTPKPGYTEYTYPHPLAGSSPVTPPTTPTVLDPATMLGQAIAQLFAADPIISGYNWQTWDSDADVVQPRGYVLVSFLSATEDNKSAERFDVQVVLEGKPKTGSAATIAAEVLGQIQRNDFATALQALITDASLTFNRATAENIKLAQSIQGDIRKRIFSFSLFGTWNVTYTP